MSDGDFSSSPNTLCKKQIVVYDLLLYVPDVIHLLNSLVKAYDFSNLESYIF